MTDSGRPRAEAGSAAGPPAPPKQQQQMRDVVEPILTEAGYHLEELAVSRAGARSVVRVVVDGEDGVSSDAIADLSRGIAAALDATGGAADRSGYTLEVSSPGVDRPLTLPRHWRRNRGRLVKVRVGEAVQTGRVVSAGEQGVMLDIDGEQRDLPYAELGPGKVQLEFGAAARAGSSDDGRKRGSKRGKEGE
ncbi:MAG: ribosome maturation factor RimP [Micromonosporaceae bacterium]